MVGRLLLRGMIVGLIAGLLAFGFARVFGEPQVAWAIAFEEKASAAAGEASEPELVDRATQAGIGLATGILVYGAAIGGLFALAFTFVYGRMGQQGARMTAALLALAGFVAITLVPSLKYPANPPAVGNAETIGVRTELFFVMLAISVGALVLAALLRRRLAPQLGAWNATILAGLAFLLVVGIAQAVLPEINEVPEDFSAVVLWRFRLAALGIQGILWGVLGLLFGAVAHHDLEARSGGIRLARTAA